MIDALKTLFENDVVSQEVRAQIEEAWEGKIRENKQAVTAELREEFAQKYEHDKATMVEAIDTMLNDRLGSEIAEFAEDRKQLAEAKAKYAVKLKENGDLMKAFVMDQLGKELIFVSGSNITADNNMIISHLSSGIYNLRVNTSQGDVTKLIIKK